MRRWGLVLGGFAILVVAFLLWRAARDDTAVPPPPIDGGAAPLASVSGTLQPRVLRPPPATGTAAVAGTVRANASQPIVGARVCAVVDDTDGTDAPCTMTDAAGGFRLEPVPLATTSVTAAAPRHRGHVVSLSPLAEGEERANVDIVLRSGVRVAGKVIDVRGAPIAAARVTSVLTVVTGADGTFELWVEPMRGVLHVSADGFATTRQQFEPPSEVEVVMHTASSITGLVVVDVRGDVLFDLTGTRRGTGRLVGTIDAPGREGEILRVWATSSAKRHTMRGDDGRFQLELEPGAYKVRAGGESPETPEVAVTITEGRDTDYSPRLPTSDTGVIVVTVVDRDGAPMSGVMVSLSKASSEQQMSSMEMTDEKGQYRRRVVVGDYEASARVIFDAPSATAVAVEAVANSERTARIVLSGTSLRVRGVVVDTQGARVAGAIVTAEDMAGSIPRTRHAISGADGQFELPSRGYRPGVEITALRPGGGASAAVRVVSDAPVRLVIEIPASIAGTVVMADGSVPSRFDIIVKTEMERVTRTFLHSGGAFTITNVPVGAIKLGAAINGIEVWTEQTVTAGHTRTGVAITLPTVAAITGRVIDAGSRTPVEGVKLNLMCTRDGEPLAFNHGDQRTDANGRFQIRELPPGPCVVEVRPPSVTWLPSNHNVMVPERGNADVGEIAIARAR